MAHVKAKWEDDIVIAMYRRGLHPQIITRLCYAIMKTLDDAV